ncbi:MAG: hypothetical protein V4596_05475 [Bdellovibrionota bacterium]
MIKLAAIFVLTVLMTGLTSCSSTSSKNTEEISLKADRKLLDKYRTEMPEDIKAENDYMALVLKDMSEVKSKPQDVRDRYYKEVRRKRDAFNKQHRQIREKFNREEKKKRDEFLAEAKKERTSFASKKHASSESSAFFSEQNTKRNVFFQDQSDARKEFESQMDQSRRDFNDDMNLKQKQFDDSYREYMKNFQEKEKQKKEEMKAAPSVAPASPATTLGTPAVNPTTAIAPATGGYLGQDKDLEEFDKLKDSKRESF